MNMNITVIKLIVMTVIIISILKLCKVFFLIKPCDNDTSCRLFKIKYVDDTGKVYFYKKKICDSKGNVCKSGDGDGDGDVDSHGSLSVENSYKDKCNDFIVILMILIVMMSIVNYTMTLDVYDSLCSFLSLICIFVFFPNFTLHAVNSNEYTDRIFKNISAMNVLGGDGKYYKYEPTFADS